MERRPNNAGSHRGRNEKLPDSEPLLTTMTLGQACYLVLKKKTFTILPLLSHFSVSPEQVGEAHGVPFSKQSTLWNINLGNLTVSKDKSLS